MDPGLGDGRRAKAGWRLGKHEQISGWGLGSCWQKKRPNPQATPGATLEDRKYFYAPYMVKRLWSPEGKASCRTVNKTIPNMTVNTDD